MDLEPYLLAIAPVTRLDGKSCQSGCYGETDTLGLFPSEHYKV
ncbi:hypothetical protein Lepto7376_0761 [[Leptolyngbya] sp. PCC 7376]|nr:hypothetical protein [[Leptolyngbya] sp. PCC 7376]AFY37159.1 hypothetical protein Lepto7376_0761 [[Leptolyngbya] sp. PCC 7376]